MGIKTFNRNIMNFKVKERKINAHEPQMNSSEMLKTVRFFCT